MKIQFRFYKLLYLAFALSLTAEMSHAASTAWQTADHIKVRLLSNVNAVAPNTTFYVGLELVPDEHWHVYWQNPGDSGMPIEIEWQLPQHISTQKLIWPIPKKIPFGSLTNYGYEGRVIIPMRMQSAERPQPKPNKIAATASWLVCKDTCIPGSAKFELPMETAKQPNTGKQQTDNDSETALNKYIQQEALSLSLMNGEITEEGNSLTMQLFASKPMFNSAKHIEFFPINEGVFMAGADSKIKWKNNYLSVSQEKAENFYKLPKNIRGLLVIDSNQAWEFEFTTLD